MVFGGGMWLKTFILIHQTITPMETQTIKFENTQVHPCGPVLEVSGKCELSNKMTDEYLINLRE